MTIPPTPGSFTATELREALTRRLQRRSIVNGQIRIPAVPGMIDEYVHLCEAIFAGVGRRFTPEQLARLTEVLTQQLSAAHRASPLIGHRHLVRCASRDCLELSRRTGMGDNRRRLRQLDRHPATALVRH